MSKLLAASLLCALSACSTTTFEYLGVDASATLDVDGQDFPSEVGTQYASTSSSWVLSPGSLVLAADFDLQTSSDGSSAQVSLESSPTALTSVLEEGKPLTHLGEALSVGDSFIGPATLTISRWDAGVSASEQQPATTTQLNVSFTVDELGSASAPTSGAGPTFAKLDFSTDALATSLGTASLSGTFSLHLHRTVIRDSNQSSDRCSDLFGCE